MVLVQCENHIDLYMIFPSLCFCTTKYNSWTQDRLTVESSKLMKIQYCTVHNSHSTHVLPLGTAWPYAFSWKCLMSFHILYAFYSGLYNPVSSTIPSTHFHQTTFTFFFLIDCSTFYFVRNLIELIKYSSILVRFIFVSVWL